MERSTDDHNILFISILHSLPPGSFDIIKAARFRQMLRQLFDAGTARPVERCAVPFIHLLAEAGQRAGDILVGQHAHHRAHLAAVARQLGQTPGQMAIVDQQPVDGGAPISLFESGEILLYLAEKTGKLLSTGLRERAATLQWLFWQVAGFGPMLGQNHHFNHYAPQPVPYAIERYHLETKRLYGVLEAELQKHPYLGGDNYSIADIATYPWVVSHPRQRIDLADYPAVRNWFERISNRPATERAYKLAEQG